MDAAPGAATVEPSGMGNGERLATQIRALAHPVRLKILQALAERRTCVCGEIVNLLPLAQSTVSQHIKVLADAGLVKGTISGPRSCYGLDTAALGALSHDIQRLFAVLLPEGEDNVDSDT